MRTLLRLLTITLALLYGKQMCYGCETRYTWMSDAVTDSSAGLTFVYSQRVTFTAKGIWTQEEKRNGKWVSVGTTQIADTATGTVWSWVCLDTEKRKGDSIKDSDKNGMNCTFQNPGGTPYSVTIKPSGGGAAQHYKDRNGIAAPEPILTPGVKVSVTEI